jgi:hypothetical protein
VCADDHLFARDRFGLTLDSVEPSRTVRHEIHGRLDAELAGNTPDATVRVSVVF